jgi:hypothetical protein
MENARVNSIKISNSLVLRMLLLFLDQRGQLEVPSNSHSKRFETIIPASVIS